MKAPHAALDRVYAQIRQCEALVAQCEAHGRPVAARIYGRRVAALRRKADSLNAKLTVTEAQKIVNEADR